MQVETVRCGNLTRFQGVKLVECCLGRISATLYATLYSTATLLIRPSDIYRVAPLSLVLRI